MTETIEQKALALLNECGWGGAHLKRTWNPRYEALCRAIEQHEAYRREVSEELTAWFDSYRAEVPPEFRRFIIPQPDPLHECLEEALARTGDDLTEHTERLRAALAARGLKIVEDK